MIRVNLLPHREERRKRRQQQFGVLAGIFALIGLVVRRLDLVLPRPAGDPAAAERHLHEGRDRQARQADRGDQEDREETASLLAKKQVVEGLQSNRSEPVQLLDQLLRQLPEGVYLKAVKQVGPKVNVAGYAQSNARVSTLMRNLGASPYLENPELVEIKAVPNPDKSGNRVNEFNMNISIKRAQAENTASSGKAAAPAKAAGAK
jgi:type IV pilus assembly protein PilN